MRHDPTRLPPPLPPKPPKPALPKSGQLLDKSGDLLRTCAPSPTPPPRVRESPTWSPPKGAISGSGLINPPFGTGAAPHLFGSGLINPPFGTRAVKHRCTPGATPTYPTLVGNQRAQPLAGDRDVPTHTHHIHPLLHPPRECFPS